MDRMRHIIPFLIAIIFITGCNSNQNMPVEPEASIQVTRLDQLEVAKDSTLVYALPQTRLKFKITAEKIIKKTGPLYRYSERFLGIKDVILKDEISYKIKTIELETVSEPDPDQYYQVSYSGKGFIPPLRLTEDGCIAGYNTNPVMIEKEEEIILTDQEPLDTSFKYTPYLEDQLVVNSTAKMAEEAANFIYRIRDNRASLVSGELNYFPSDGSALSISLNEMDRMEKDFLSLFLGKEVKEEVVFNLDYLPESEVSKALFFRFSQFKGLVDKTDLSGSPYYLTVQLKTDNLITNDTLNKVTYHGLFYRVPAKATVKLLDGTNTLFTSDATVAQFGSVLSLPASLCTIPGISISFYKETGAINSIDKQ
ncbi:DUF4831 family protein [Saccharicrinis sp. FJH62]|uniref:DUF4831 family protein n=1 Tax=Saccharicrinis sp. FJH62 TaxID=3344657 RepID=UPI0035D45745